MSPRSRTGTIDRMLGRLLAIPMLMLFAGLLAFAGCGSDDDGETTGNGSNVDSFLPRNIVTKQQIESTPADSSERALLEWWRGLQFGDVDAVVDGSTPDTADAVSSDELATLVREVGPSVGRLEIDQSREGGRRDVVRAVVVNFPDGEKPSGTPETFVLRREGTDDAWLVEAESYLKDLGGGSGD
jgi:hypothetical protein